MMIVFQDDSVTVSFFNAGTFQYRTGRYTEEFKCFLETLPAKHVKQSGDSYIVTGPCVSQAIAALAIACGKNSVDETEVGDD